MLTLNGVAVHYGGVQALKGISLAAEKGCITSLIGANGAGKSTTLKAVSGLVPITAGDIRFEGRRIDGLSPEKIVELGVGHVPEGKQLFLEMTILDNLYTGAHLRKDSQNLEQDLDRIYGYFPVLRRARYRKASQLSGGEQQMLAIGRGLMCSPKLLMLDEPSLGLSPILTREVGAMIERIAKEGISILLIEQNASLALQLARKCYVLETGSMVLEGDGQALQNNEHVRAAYLGISPGEEARELLKPAAEPARRPTRWQEPAEEPEKGLAEKEIEEKGTAARLPPEPAREAFGQTWAEPGSPARWSPEWRSDEPRPGFRWTAAEPAGRAVRPYGRREEAYERGASPAEDLEAPVYEDRALRRREGGKPAPARVVKRILSLKQEA